MSKEQLEMIPLGSIEADQKKNPRKKEDKNTFEELVRSINEKGIVVPVIVMPDNNHYDLVCGFRRFKAAQALKMNSIPAIIRSDLDEKGAAQIRTIENLQREDLDILDEAAGFKKLLTDFDWRVEDIAEKVGKSEPYIRKRLAILKSPDYIQKAVTDNRIALGHAMLLNNIPDEGERKEMLKQIGYGNWSVKELYRNISENDRKINKNTPFDILKCQGCRWLGLKEKQLPLEDLGKTTKGQDLCFNKSCFTQKMEAAFKKAVGDLKKGDLSVEVLDRYQSPNWRWESFTKNSKKDLIDPEKCKKCREHVIIVDKGRHGSFTIQEICKKGGCGNWKANVKAYQETKKEREKKKKEKEKLDQMMEEVLRKIGQDKLNFLLIKNLIGGGYGGISPADKAFARRFGINTKDFSKYQWGESFLAQISNRHPKDYPEMIKVHLILNMRYQRHIDLKALHKEVVKAGLKERIRKEMVKPEKRSTAKKKTVKKKVTKKKK